MITETNTKEIYDITGLTPLAGGYEFTFPYTSAQDVRVYTTGNKTDTEVSTSNYTIDNSGATPKVVFIAGYNFPEGQTKLTIIRNVSYSQELDLRNGDLIDADKLEDALDDITQQIQQIAEKVDRAILSSVSDTAPLSIPEASQRNNMLLGFDSEGKAIPVLTTDIEQKLAQALAAEESAITAKNAAENAQHEVESAQSAAETAQGKAETAQAAAESAEASSQTLLASIKTKTEESIASINTAKTEAVGAVTTQQATSVAAVQAAQNTAESDIAGKKASALTAIDTAKTAAVAAVNTQKETSVAAADREIIAKRDSALTDIQTARTNAVNAITTQKDTSLQEIEQLASERKSEINSLAANQKADVKQYTDSVVASAKTEIDTEKTTAVTAVQEEGDAKVAIIGSSGDAEVTRVQSVYQTDLNELKGDLDTERNTRIEGDTALSTRLKKNRYEIDNLKAKAEGKLYRTETVEAEAYTVDVPSSVAPYAEVQKIGGKSVVWNQLVDPISTIVNGITLTASNGTWTLSGTATSSGGRLNSISSSFINIMSGHKYAIMIYKSENIDMLISDNNSQKVVTGIGSSSFIFTPDSSCETVLGINVSKDITYSATIKLHIFDLTQMFGSGNEPTLEECKKIFSAEYYPYDAGTIKSFPVKTVRSVNAEGTEIGSMDVSSVTSDLKSTPLVKDEWVNGKKIIKLAEYDLGALTWNYDSTNNFWYSNEALPNQMNGTFLFCETVPFEGMSYNGSNLGTNVNGTVNVWIRNGSSTNPPMGKAIYILETPIEETVPEIDNYINVEGGGILTFESDDTVHMPVPSTDRFVVDLTSTTEETT